MSKEGRLTHSFRFRRTLALTLREMTDELDLEEVTEEGSAVMKAET